MRLPVRGVLRIIPLRELAQVLLRVRKLKHRRVFLMLPALNANELLPTPVGLF